MTAPIIMNIHIIIHGRGFEIIWAAVTVTVTVGEYVVEVTKPVRVDVTGSAFVVIVLLMVVSAVLVKWVVWVVVPVNVRVAVT